MSKTIYGRINRSKSANTIFSDGDFAYRVNDTFIEWPDFLKDCVVPDGCCDKDDNFVFSVRSKEHPIVIFDKEGKFVRSIGANIFGRTHGIFVTQEGTILCADDGAHVIREMSFTGEILNTFGNLNQPCDNGFDKDIWIHLKMRGELPVDLPFDGGIECMEGLKTIKKAGAPFNKPTKMVQGPSGDLYASDGYANASCHHFTRDGKLLKTWGGPGHEPGQFWLPHGVWVDRLERVWVADRENSRCQVFEPDGTLIADIEDLIWKPSMIWSDSDNIYIGEVDGGITILDMELNIKAQLGYFGSQLVIHGICGDSKSNLYIQTLNLGRGTNVYKLERV